MEFVFKPIGIIHSPFKEKKITPIQPSRSTKKGKVEIFPEFQEGLDGIEKFSHIILLYAFHESKGYQLHIKPFLDDQLHGLFTTRYPERPNPIGISTVKLISRKDNLLEIDGVDVLDGTPLLDIKPHIPGFDIHGDVKTGWYSSRSEP